MKLRNLLIVFVLAATCLLGSIPARAQTYTDLHDFNAGAGDPSGFFVAKLAQGRDGNFYAESNAGGTGNGTVAKITPSGSVSVILSFNGTDGSNEIGGMTLGADGNLYGDTWNGGSANQGITFKVTPAGVETPLHNFTNTGDGINPANALVLGMDGNFYGTTNTAPDTIYKVSSSGVFKTLHTLSNADGAAGGQLSQGSDGNFYGGMNAGGAKGFGTLFKITAAGQFTVLHNFTGTDGSIAAPGMVQGSNGLFYGTGEMGGVSNAGVVFKITSGGTYTLLHSLNGTSDGQQATVLMLATDGNFYGPAVHGGSASCGTIFKVTPAGVFSVIHNFDNTHGCNPAQYLTEGTDGKLYGLTSGGGAHGNGVFYSLDLGLSPYVLLQTTSGKVGSKVGIIGQGFDSTSVVKFNGVTATKVTRTGTTYLAATVPAGASSGFVTVTTGSTTLTSSQKYIVHNSWGSGAAVPTARAGGASGVINGKIYVVSGATASTIVGVNEIYNPATNTWTTGAAIPTPRYAPAFAVVNNILYVMGGIADSSQTPLNVVEAYDPATDTWTTKAPMPTTDDSMFAVVENKLIYVVGGFTSGARTAIVQRYNPATNTWTSEAPLLLAKSGSTLGLLGTTIVSTGGFPNSINPTGDTEGYNATSNTWSALTADPTGRQYACGASIGSQLYVAGGSGAGAFGDALTLNESYNLSKNAWTTQAPMPKAAIAAMPVGANNLLYCFGGTDDGRLFVGNFFSNLQIYQP